MGSHVQNYVMLCNVLAVFWFCSPLVLKQVGTPCWGWWWWEAHKGTSAMMGATLGSRGRDMRHADTHAACVARPPVNTGMPDIPKGPWIFFRLHEYHEPAWPWRVSTQIYLVFQLSTYWLIFIFVVLYVFLK